MTTRLIHISDVHFGVEDRRALDAVERTIASERPDILVCTGDLTQRAKKSEYSAAEKWFASLDIAVVLEPGNHDMPYYNMRERFFDPYARYHALREAVKSPQPSDDLVFVSLKSTVRAQPRFPWSDGFVTKRALASTVSELHALEGDNRTKIVTCHHPLLGAEDNSSNPTIGGTKAFESIAMAGADAVLSGHIHMPIDEERCVGGHCARMIGAGTLSTRLRHGAPASFRMLSVESGGKIEAELRLID